MMPWPQAALVRCTEVVDGEWDVDGPTAILDPSIQDTDLADDIVRIMDDDDRP